MSQERRPNILFFFTDDQRFDTIRALGNDEIHTPHIDSLVESGTAFTRAHIMGGTSPAVCMPSRAMLMTGRTLFHLEGQGQGVPREHALLGETLQAAGYHCFGTGKWHNGAPAYARSFDAGDEIFFGGMEDHWNVPAFRFDPEGRYDGSLPLCTDPWLSNKIRRRPGDHVTAGTHSSELFCDAAINYLREYRADNPFFMYVSFMAPHDPRTMPRKYLDVYDPETLSLSPNVMGAHPFDNGELRIRDEMLEGWPRTPEAVRRHLAEYYAMITHADANLGRVLEVLRETGQADNTIIVFAGDNGLALGRHGLMGKQSLYDHSVRVPLIFSGPGVPRGEQRDAFCYLLDVFPTLCDLAGVPVPVSVEGKSLAPALGSKDACVRDHLFLAYRHLHRGLREERLKLIEYAVEGRRTTQLFDLQEDPWELCNLAGRPEYASELQRLRGRLREEAEALGDTHEQGRTFWGAWA